MFSENRRRLADATTCYFEQLPMEAMAEENALAKDMMSGAGTIDFDSEAIDPDADYREG